MHNALTVGQRVNATIRVFTGAERGPEYEMVTVPATVHKLNRKSLRVTLDEAVSAADWVKDRAVEYSDVEAI